MAARLRRRRPILGPSILIGAILVCVAASYVPWWAIDAVVDQNGQGVYCENYWTTVSPAGTFQTRCGGAGPPNSGSGQPLNVPHVASVMTTSASASLLAGGLAAVAILLSVLPRPGRYPRRALAVVILGIGVLAATASFAGAAYFMQALPHAWQSDNYTYQTGDPGLPSFSGHDKVSSFPFEPGVTETWTWAPTLGWYLPWAAGFLILAGSVVTWRTQTRAGGPGPA